MEKYPVTDYSDEFGQLFLINSDGLKNYFTFAAN